MEIRFEKTGAERKALVMAISEITGIKAEYMGVPGFSFRVGGYIISKDGMMETGEAANSDVSSLLAALKDRGFIPSDAPAFILEDEIIADTANNEEIPDRMIIELLSDGFTDIAFHNLEKLVAGKAALIRRAIGDDLAENTGALPILREDGRICFPWFRFGMEPDAMTAWSCFFNLLCETAKNQKRVILKEKSLDEGASEKFAMRCFLLKLGFIGDEYKDARRIILAGLPGDGSFKSGKRSDQDGAYCGRNN